MKLSIAGRFTIFWRIYLFGLALLFVFMLGVFAMLALFVGPENDVEAKRVGRWIAHTVLAEHDATERRELLDSLRADAHVALAIYDSSGARIDANTSLHPTRLDPAVVTRLRFDPDFFIEDQDSALVVRGAAHQRGEAVVLQMLEPKSFVLGGGTLTIMLLGLALVALPIARSITVPIRKLQATMTAFGGGDVSARAPTSGSEEMIQLANAFNAMADRIVRLVRTERLLVAGVAHELRTPLQRIRIALELAADDEQEQSPRARYIESIATDLHDLDHIVSDVLMVSTLEISRSDVAVRELSMAREPVHAAALIRDSSARFEAAHAQRSLVVGAEEQLPEVWVEPRLIHRAVTNLLENAHRYAPPDTAIELSVGCQDGELVISVRDHGPGIAPEHLPNLFSPFYRADSARSRAAGGAGLGLTIVKAIVEAHGGTVSVVSETMRGSIFSIRLPIPVDPETAVHPDVTVSAQ